MREKNKEKQLKKKQEKLENTKKYTGMVTSNITSPGSWRLGKKYVWVSAGIAHPI